MKNNVEAITKEFSDKLLTYLLLYSIIQYAIITDCFIVDIVIIFCINIML